MKCLKLTVLSLCVGMIHTHAQLRLPVHSSLRNDFQKVVADYPVNFENIRGRVIDENPQTIEYASQVQLSDAQECVITKYSSGLKPIYSWQANMFVSEDFEAAAKKYKWLFSQLKGMNIYYVRDQYTLRGNFEEADESKKFSTSVLTVTSPPTPLEKLRVEVSLQFEFPEWKVNLLLYEKEREDDERGEIAE